MHPLDKGVIALAFSIGCFAVGWVPVPVAADASRALERLGDPIGAGSVRRAA